MIKLVLNNVYVQSLIGLAIIIGMILCIFPPDLMFFKWQANFSVQIMILYFFLGLFFLLLRQERLVFVSFTSCAVLCMFLRGSSDESNVRSFYPKLNNEQTIEIAHFNISAFEDNYEGMVDEIRNSDADLISVQEVTPDWNYVLNDGLYEMYPYNKTVNRIDFYGLAVYSKHPFKRIDTFHYQEIPNIIGSIEIDSTHGEIFFISSHTNPLVSKPAYERIVEHLDLVGEYAANLKAPVFAFGDYNSVPWSPEIQAFRLKSKLNNSRRGFTPTSPGASMPFLQIPIDHIFYSNDFQCVSFNSISGSNSNSLGIKGKFQFKYKYVKKATK